MNSKAGRSMRATTLTSDAESNLPSAAIPKGAFAVNTNKSNSQSLRPLFTDVSTDGGVVIMNRRQGDSTKCMVKVMKILIYIPSGPPDL